MTRFFTHGKDSPRLPFQAGTSKAWWTEERNNKLKYIMEKYNDVEKASRVLGVPVHVIQKRLHHLKEGDYDPYKFGRAKRAIRQPSES